MKFFYYFISFVFVTLTTFFAISCSTAKNPVEIQNEIKVIPSASDSESQEYCILAVYDATIDPIAKTFTVTPSERIADFHFPLTQLYPNVLQIVGYGWTPNFWADIKLTHPFPGSGIDAFDPRIIAILPANPGVSFNYPIFNCIGNNSVVLEPDGYTKLFDNLGGSISGNTNPSKAYFKNQPYRVWSSTGVTSETQRWNLRLAGFGGPMQFKLVVDISTNYPNSPQPAIDNAPEPVEIEAEVKNDLRPTGIGSATVEVLFKDWQGYDNINCVLECPPLFNSLVQLSYTDQGPYPDTYIFTSTITNELHAPEGDYKVLIAAWDVPTAILIFNEVTVQVRNEPTPNPVDVTPPWLNISPRDISIDGNNLYVAGGLNGFHIFDITDPENPSWITKLDLYGEVACVFALNDYAYACNDKNLFVINVETPASPYIENGFAINDSVDVYVTNGYAYVADTTGLTIFDIDPLDSAYKVKSISISGECNCVFAADGYAYVGADKLNIIDVDPPESAYIVKMIDIPVFSIYVSGNYAYAACELIGLNILDVTVPENAEIISTVYTNNPNDVCLLGDYAFVADKAAGMQIIDIQTPETAYIVKTVPSSDTALKVCVITGYAYLLDYGSGINVIDIEPVNSANIINTIIGINSGRSICELDDYVYMASPFSSIYIIDIEPFSSIHPAKVLAPLNHPNDIVASNGYAYATSWDGLSVIKVDPPESAYVCKTLMMPNSGNLCISDEYIYALNRDASGAHFYIVDINPPEGAFIVKTISIGQHEVFGIAEWNGYAFVTNGYWDEEDQFHPYLNIYDVDPPESAHIIDIIPGYNGMGIYASNGYLYTGGGQGLLIWDIDPPDSAYVIKDVPLPSYGTLFSIHVHESYAYIAKGQSSVVIVDINPPEDAFVVANITSLEYVWDICVAGDYAYVADWDQGLRIFQLW